MMTQETRPLVQMVAQEQHYVIAAERSGEVLSRVISQQPDVVIIPDKAEPVEGVDLLAVLRRMTRACIIVVGDGVESRMAQALLQGADLFVPTTVAPRQLQARLRSLLRPRRSEVSEADDGDKTEQAETDDLFTGLSQREEQLLQELLGQRGVPIRPSELVAKVWGDTGSTSSLRLYIARLRAKLAAHGLFTIETCMGFGYRIVALRERQAWDRGGFKHGTS